jgi:hypothetical protein
MNAKKAYIGRYINFILSGFILLIISGVVLGEDPHARIAPADTSHQAPARRPMTSDAERLRELVQHMGSPDYPIRNASQDALEKLAKRMGKSAVELLKKEGLGNRDPEIEWRLNWVLFKIAPEEFYDEGAPVNYCGGPLYPSGAGQYDVYAIPVLGKRNTFQIIIIPAKLPKPPALAPAKVSIAIINTKTKEEKELVGAVEPKEGQEIFGGYVTVDEAKRRSQNKQTNSSTKTFLNRS